MGAPEHVPTPVAEKPRTYASPPRRPGQWRVDRPGDFASGGRQPAGPRLGSQGPDQGYALKLARTFEGRLTLRTGEHEADALAGAVAIGLKRASLFGRAPVVHDITVGLTVFGYLDSSPAEELVRLRAKLFEDVAHFHHYDELREIVDMVPTATLELTHLQVAELHQANWRSLLNT